MQNQDQEQDKDPAMDKVRNTIVNLVVEDLFNKIRDAGPTACEKICSQLTALVFMGTLQGIDPYKPVESADDQDFAGRKAMMIEAVIKAWDSYEATVRAMSPRELRNSLVRIDY